MTKEVQDVNSDKDLQQIWESLEDVSEDAQKRRSKVMASVSENPLHQFPSELYILTALDELVGCFSLGGQLKSYYRYGFHSNCQQQRSKFWFAIKNGTFRQLNGEVRDESDLERRRKIQEFYRDRLFEDKAKGSSEDIWDAREIPLQNPFKGYQKDIFFQNS